MMMQAFFSKLEEGVNSDHIKSEEGLSATKIESDVIIKKEEADVNGFYNSSTGRAGSRANGRTRKPKAKPLAGVKNVVKNYGKAMCSFAYSEIAIPYLGGLAAEENSTAEGFISWIQNKKEHVDSIESLRALLLPSEKDDVSLASYKRIFQKISEVFLKYYCINWIYSGKLTHKQTHLSFRHKMLRRIRSPENFTYLQNAPKKGAKE